MSIRLVVFDLDGTLVDSSRDLADSVNELLVERGAPALPLETIVRMVGEGAAVLVRRALAASGLPPDSAEALDRFLAHYARRLTNHTRPYPGILEALDAIRTYGCALAVLTNKPQQATVEILERLDLARWFSEVLGGDTPFGRKPDPGGLLAIVRNAGVAPDETLLVGDSVIDLQTAHNADCGICLARYGFGLHLDGVRLRGDERFVDAASQLVETIRTFPAGTPSAPAPGTSQSRT